MTNLVIGKKSSASVKDASAMWVAALLASSCATAQTDELGVFDVEFEELFASPESYGGNFIRLTGSLVSLSDDIVVIEDLKAPERKIAVAERHEAAAMENKLRECLNRKVLLMGVFGFNFDLSPGISNYPEGWGEFGIVHTQYVKVINESGKSEETCFKTSQPLPVY